MATDKRAVQLQVWLREGVADDEIDRVVAALMADPAVAGTLKHEQDIMTCPKCGATRLDWIENRKQCLECFMAQNDEDGTA